MRRGVIESQGSKGFWVRVTDLKVLPNDAASFEPSQAPLSGEERKREKQVGASEFSNEACPSRRPQTSAARVCLLSDSARRGVLESHVKGSCWAVRFADPEPQYPSD